jgi:hypothetical protein
LVGVGVELCEELPVVDPDVRRHRLPLAVHEHVEVLMDVQDLALVRERVEPERLDAVGETVDAWVPGRRAGLHADQPGRVGHVGRRDAVVVQHEHEHRRDDRSQHAEAGERRREEEWAAAGAGPGTPRVGPALGRLDLPRRSGCAGLLGQRRAMVARGLTGAAGPVSLVASDPESRKVFRIWRFFVAFRIPR